MNLADIVKILEGSFLCGEELQHKAFTKARASDLMSDVLADVAEGCLIITGLTTIQVVRTAAVSGAGAIVFVRNKRPPEPVIEMGRTEEIPLLSTPFSMFETCGRLHARGLSGM